MGIFDRKIEKKKAESMTRTQRNRQKHAIWDYYKKKNARTKTASKRRK